MKCNMKDLQIIPTEQCVLLEKAVEEKNTKMGFIIPEAVGEAQPMVVGTITTMGIEEAIDFKTTYGETVDLKHGTKVLFERGRGTVVEIKGNEYILIPLRFVTALVNNYDE